MNLVQYLHMKNDDKFAYFLKTRFITNRTPKYWVNWDNVMSNMQEHELNLNTLNYLVGKDNIKEIAYKLFQQQPQLLKSIPILLASRDLKMDVLTLEKDNKMSTYTVDFSHPDLHKLNQYLDFMEETGLLHFLSKGLKESLVDYLLGVQVGLDTNGRKNRSGAQNELILSRNLKAITKFNSNLEFITQATAKNIESHWRIKVPEMLQSGKKGGRRYDGAVYNTKQDSVTIIETNFYGSGGSKLKAVAGEFMSLYETSLKDTSNVKFVWISDGPGWDQAKNPLREAFDVIPTIINLHMVKSGMLEEIILANKMMML
ncbi:type II restriction endonuclease [Bombilactobacillus bombi]|uniref:type II restriction endonuclease n=1 Tax=Bombilactobacillus bombi TaxID=1303590 RepID=UPI0015E62948|nr:type II restriction endonuclease [Bombilactobacillus bombi]MBA1433675.1 restriction endonuclease [Bombilactobacillus bombi]